MKRLTEKQANEWKELGLPDATITNSPCCPRPTTSTTVQAEKAKTTNKTRSKVRNKVGGKISVLAMLLAIKLTRQV